MTEGKPVGVGLADAIATVRAELEQAIAGGEASGLAFRAGPIEMELQVSFSNTGSVNAGVKAWVVTGAAKGDRTNSTVHRLKLSMTPVHRRDGTDALIDDVADR